MSNIQSLLESANPWKSLQSDASKLANKWAKTGLLEGLGSEVDKNNMSILLENQAKQLVVESSTTGAGTSAGTFTVGQSENWAGIALPLVRKVFGQIAAKEFVSVQPMNLPSGLVFFLDFQYGTTVNPFSAGDSLYGTRNASGQFPFQTTGTTGGLYGAGRFAYTTNQFSASIPVTGSANGGTVPTVGAGTASLATASWAELNFDSDYSASVISNRIYKVTVTTASVLSSFDPDAVRAFYLSGSGFTVANSLPQFTTYNYTNGTIAFFFTGSTTQATANASLSTVFYNKITADNKYAPSEIKEAYMMARFGMRRNDEKTATVILKEGFIKEYVDSENIGKIKSDIKDFKGKKLALTLAFKAAKNEILLLTDADCKPATNLWLQSISSSYSNPETEIVSPESDNEGEPPAVKLKLSVRCDHVQVD